MADDRPLPDLYERDFYAWTQVQADALRTFSPRSNSVDWERLIEEVEGLGVSQKNAVRSHLVQIIAHLMKLATSRARDPRAHWRVEVEQHRTEADLLLTAAIRREIERELAGLHRRALRLAQNSLDEHERAAVIDPKRCWSLPELLGETRDPLEEPDAAA